jgi:hypothetical protein
MWGVAQFGFIRFGGYVIIIATRLFERDERLRPICIYPLWRICYNNRNAIIETQCGALPDLDLSALADML